MGNLSSLAFPVLERGEEQVRGSGKRGGEAQGAKEGRIINVP